MSSPRLVVLSFDGLATSAISAYGASWVATPGFDALAAQSSVFDRCTVPSDDPAEVLRRIWVAGVGPGPGDAGGLLSQAADAGVVPLLVTDSAAVVGSEAAEGFAEQILVEFPPPEVAAEDVSETALARLLAAGMQRLESMSEAPCLLWLHSEFLTRIWDAPRALMPPPDPEEDEGPQEGAQWEEMEDLAESLGAAVRPPHVFDTITPPELKLAEPIDPDEMLAWMNTYACQVRLIDQLLTVVLDRLAEGPPTTVVLVSTGGFALGEHGYVGRWAGPWRSPALHVPLMIRGPDFPPLRVLTLCQSSAVGPTLQRLVGGAAAADKGADLLALTTPQAWAAHPEEFQPRCEAQGRGGGARVITTPRWALVQQEGRPDALFLKPDDRFDINDIADRMPEVVQQLAHRSE